MTPTDKINAIKNTENSLYRGIGSAVNLGSRSEYGDLERYVSHLQDVIAGLVISVGILTEVVETLVPVGPGNGVTLIGFK